MVRKQDNPNELSIRANNFGGLNTTTSSVNLPIEDAKDLLNVDVDISGSLKHRPGTDFVLSLSTSDPISVQEFESNFGIPFVAVRFGTTLRVYHVSGGTFNQIYTASNVFKFTGRSNITILPGDLLKLLLLQGNEVPVQLSVYEFQTSVVSAGASITWADPISIIVDATAAGAAEVFINGVYDSGATVAKNASDVTVTPTNSLVVGDVVTVVYICWQWWAEAELWRGEHFFKAVPRFGASDADKNVSVPATIFSDLPESMEPPYGIFALWTNKKPTNWDVNFSDNFFWCLYEYNEDGGTFDDEKYYQFGDGTIIQGTNLVNAEVPSPTPFVISFGKESNPLEYSYTYFFINQGNDWITITGHELRDGDRVLLEYPDNSTRQAKLVYDNAEVELINADTVKFREARTSLKPVIGVSTFPEHTLSSYTQASGLFTTTGVNSLTTGDVIRIRAPRVRNQPTQFSVTTNYYVEVVSATTFYIHFDPMIQRRHDPNSAITFTTVRIIDYLVGGYKIIKRHYQNVLFVRMRKFSFNNNTGVTADWDTEAPVHFYVDEVSVGVNLEYNTNTVSGEIGRVILSVGDNPDPQTSGDIIKSGEASQLTTFYTVLGNDTDSINIGTNQRVEAIHNETTWAGSSAQSTRFLEATQSTHNGGYVPAYGLGLYANYDTGNFPSVGHTFQERLILGGFVHRPSTAVFSATSDVLDDDNFYNYFQITNALDNTDADPFDVVLSSSNNERILGFISWQQFLFVFTDDSVHRSANISSAALLTSTNRAFVLVANKGAVNSNCFVITESDIYFLNESAVFSVPLVFEGEYRTSEQSLKVRRDIKEQVKVNNRSWLKYDKTEFKLYLGLHTDSSVDYANELWVYNVETESWTEYKSYPGFNTWDCTTYRDATLGDNILAAVTTNCKTGLLTFNSERPIDFAETYSGANASTYFVTNTLTTRASRLVYKHSIPSIKLPQVEDLAVWYGATLATATLQTFGTDWEKVSKDTIKLLFTPTDNYVLAVAPNPSNSWYGTGLYLNGVGVYVDNATFGTPDITSLCSTYNLALASVSLNTIESFRSTLLQWVSSGGSITITNPTAVVGQVIPTYYESIAYTQDALHLNKRAKAIYMWFTSNTETYDEIDYTALDAFGSSKVYDIIKYPTSANVVIYGDSLPDGSFELPIAHVHNNIEFDKDWILYRELLTRVGYVFTVSVFSSDIYTWELAGYQFLSESMDASSYISGGR